MLPNPLDHLGAGVARGWAGGRFNVYNLESARAVIAGAANLRAPVMIQPSEGTVKHVGFWNIASIVHRLVEDAIHSSVGARVRPFGSEGKEA